MSYKEEIKKQVADMVPDCAVCFEDGANWALQSSVVKEAIAVIDYHFKTICACYEAFGKFNTCKACRILETYDQAVEEAGGANG